MSRLILRQFSHNLRRPCFAVASVSFARTPVSFRNTPLNFSSFNNSPTFIRTFASGKIVVNVPPMAESIQEGTLQSWNKNVNDFVAGDELVASIETDKIVVEVRAPEPGVVTEHFAEVNATVRVGEPLFSFTPQAAPAGKEEKSDKKEKAPEPKKEVAPEKKAEKAPEKKAEEPKASAPAPSQKSSPPSAPSSASSPAKTSAPSDSSARTERRVPMNRMRLRIAERLKSAQNTYALLTTFQEVDMKNLTQLRADFKDEFQKQHGVKLGFMSAFVKAATAALLDQPIVNAVISENDIIYRDFVDISVAVATPRGLVVPVLRNCEKMGFADIERQINELGERARNGQLAVEDMAGGTFTISNGGVYGSLMGTPIVNPPQSAILGMHSIVKRPVVVDDKNTIEVRPMMYIALTYDHRLIDGREAVTFLKKIKSGIEDPRRFLLGL